MIKISRYLLMLIMLPTVAFGLDAPPSTSENKVESIVPSVPENKPLIREEDAFLEDIAQDIKEPIITNSTHILGPQIRRAIQSHTQHVQPNEYYAVDRGHSSIFKEVSDEEKEGENRFGIQVRHSSEVALAPVTTLDSLNLAYDALLLGHVESAITLYKEVLAVQPEHEVSLLGLATSYQRLHQYEQARQLYAQLLELYPNNIKALNNFLALASEDAPEEALNELLQLQHINPRFSPIPAQIGMIYVKKKEYPKAERFLRKAILLDRNNMSYRYNLAVVLDNMGRAQEAVELYRQLMVMGQEGKALPVSKHTLAERVMFLRQIQ